MADTTNQTTDTIIMWGVALIAQYTSALTADISDDDDDDDDDDNYDGDGDAPPPQYGAPIAYEKKNWSLADAGWGDTECLECL